MVQLAHDPFAICFSANHTIQHTLHSISSSHTTRSSNETKYCRPFSCSLFLLTHTQSEACFYLLLIKIISSSSSSLLRLQTQEAFGHSQTHTLIYIFYCNPQVILSPWVDIVGDTPKAYCTKISWLLLSRHNVLLLFTSCASHSFFLPSSSSFCTGQTWKGLGVQVFEQSFFLSESSTHTHKNSPFVRSLATIV